VTVSLPVTDRGPDHEPEAVQDLAFDAVQRKVVEPPGSTVRGVAVIDTRGYFDAFCTSVNRRLGSPSAAAVVQESANATSKRASPCLVFITPPFA
jgi:hypothetical protein